MKRPFLWIAAWAATLAAVTVIAHPTPLYTVETDLIGEYIPAARELARGALSAPHYTYKGPGYPALLALASAACGGDSFLAARLLSVAGAAIAAWLAWALVSQLSGPAIAGLALALLLVTPTFVRYAIEAGTDAPALALMLGATLLVVRARSVRAAVAAGLLAGAAVLTRGNAAFLVLAGTATLVLRSMWEGRTADRALARGLAGWAPPAAYAIACAVPIAVWAWIAARVGVHDRNFLNVAYELYGRRLPWEEFERTIGVRFGSLGQVLAFDPAHAAARIGANLFVHRARDLIELVPPWIGALALCGGFLLVRRAWMRRAARTSPAENANAFHARVAMLLHVGGASLVLATVFYNARFALYLAPFYAGAAALVLHGAASWLARHERATVRRAGQLAPGALVACGAVVAVLATSAMLAEAPHEVRAGGRALAAVSRPSEVVLARKPHVAHFAERGWNPLPPAMNPFAFVHAAQATGAQWLFFSAVERTQRPELAVLADSAVRLPGLVPAGFAPGPHGFALYRLTESPIDSLAFRAALIGAVERGADRAPGDFHTQMAAALQLLQLEESARALARLDALRARGGIDARTEQLRSDAEAALGHLDSAAAACERALALAPPVASRWARLAVARARQGRLLESRACWERAVALEPASIAWLDRLGHVHIALHEYTRAAAVFERCAGLAPDAAEWRRKAMGAWQLAGDTRRMRRVFDDGLRAGIPAASLLTDDGMAATAP